MRYFLVGLPGSGKSHWGKIWSEKIKIPYFDLDEIIENNEGYSISQIFELEGEDHFRHLESFYLNKLIDNYQAFIISTGGGTPCFNNNMDLLNNKGTTVYLNPPLEEIAKRVCKPGENKRPLFSQCKNNIEVLEKLKELHEKRFAYYHKANIHLEKWNESTIKNL